MGGIENAKCVNRFSDGLCRVLEEELGRTHSCVKGCNEYHEKEKTRKCSNCKCGNAILYHDAFRSFRQLTRRKTRRGEFSRIWNNERIAWLCCTCFSNFNVLMGLLGL